MLFSRNRHTSGAPDSELIGSYLNSHDDRCIGELFQRYTHLVFGVCMKYLKDEDDSKDAVMEIFESLGEKLKKHSVENFKSWLHSVTRNHCLMELRKKKQVFVREEDIVIKHAALVEMHPGLHLNHTEEKEMKLQQLEAAVKTLAPEQRRCVELFFLQEKCYREVAEITGYSMKQVKSFIQNGKRNLRLRMED